MSIKNYYKNILGAFLIMTLCACSSRVETIENSGEPMSKSPTRIRLVFTGDIMTHEKQLHIAKALGTPDMPYNFMPQFENIAHLLKGDVVIGNLETVLKGQGPYYGYPSFNTPDTLAIALKCLNFNVLLLANNHILDHGIEAGLRTDSFLKSLGFTTLGIARSKQEYILPILEVKDYKIGFINAAYGSNHPVENSIYVPHISEIDVAADVKNLRERGADFIVASYHFGEEYKLSPNKKQRDLVEESFAYGVDVVVGHHPHVLQPMEVISKHNKNHFVAWSLGNFISSQRTVPRERTVILAIDLLGQDNTGLELDKVSIAPLYVDMVVGKYTRLLPTNITKRTLSPSQALMGQPNASFAQKQLQKSKVLNKTLYKVHEQVLEFLELPSEHNEGFHTLWQKQVSE